MPSVAKRPAKTWVEISRSALLENARTMRIAASGSRLMAALKANAYGHGLPQVAAALNRSNATDWFAVDTLQEARAVREAGSKKPVLILGYTPMDELAATVREGFSLTVYNPETIVALGKIATARKPAKVHVKLETGTSRQGVLPKDVASFAKLLAKTRNVFVEGADTHFANIEDTSDPTYANQQSARFDDMVLELDRAGVRPEYVHSACSAAVMLYPQTHTGMVRSGIAMYGLWPSKETRVTMAQRSPKMALVPALTWKAIVAQVKPLPAGTPISYGLTEKLTRASRIAVIPIGYWDGFDRGMSSVGHVLIRGRRAKVLGRVCMNMCVVDVTDIPGVKPEDEVVVIGSQGKERISAEEFAGLIGTINYEAVTRINPMIPRVLVP